ncbi:MAG: YdcF family protein [Candidatus Micrarchaeota archaeon]|nr:YdcF family protein [Candidatus Micrarchaeota archaeon]
MGTEYDAVICLGRKPVTQEARADIASRVHRAVSLFKESGARYLILSGGRTFGTPYSEALFMQRIARRLGVPKKAIILEENSGNTHENAKHTYKIAKKLRIGRVAVVTSSYHILRSALIFKRQFRRAKIGFFASHYPINTAFLAHLLRELLQIIRAEVLGLR